MARFSYARYSAAMLDCTSARPASVPATQWGAIVAMSLLTFVLVASEFLPVSLLTPIAADLRVTEGQAGQTIAVSGAFAIFTSLLGNSLLSRIDRRLVVIGYAALLVVSGTVVALAPNYLVFMLGRALVGVAIGGYWSISTAILARLARPADLPSAIAALQGGTALAALLAAPLGAYLGGVIGWRGAFGLIVPVALINTLWLLAVMPGMPPARPVPPRAVAALFRTPLVATGMAATAFAFMGQFALATYIRPFLEVATGLGTETLSLVLLGLGAGGLGGTLVAGPAIRRSLGTVLVAIPLFLMTLALALIALSDSALVVAVLFVAWGLSTTPIPIAWGTWMTRVIPDDLEAGGAAQVALIQLAITAGAFFGGLLLDAAGWPGPFWLSVGLLAAAAGLAAQARP